MIGELAAVGSCGHCQLEKRAVGALQLRPARCFDACLSNENCGVPEANEFQIAHSIMF